MDLSWSALLALQTRNILARSHVIEYDLAYTSLPNKFHNLPNKSYAQHRLHILATIWEAYAIYWLLSAIQSLLDFVIFTKIGNT